jgi:hypothetical protein
MRMEPRGSGRVWIALVGLAVLALLVWKTMEPGKLQYVTWILLGFFGFRVALTALAARYSKGEGVTRPGGDKPGREGELAGKPEQFQADGRKQG